jgi:hypothetical protein
MKRFGRDYVRVYTPDRQRRWAGQPVLVCYGDNMAIRCARGLAVQHLCVTNIIHVAGQG